MTPSHSLDREECLDDLPSRPPRRGIGCQVEMHDLSPVVGRLARAARVFAHDQQQLPGLHRGTCAHQVLAEGVTHDQRQEYDLLPKNYDTAKLGATPAHGFNLVCSDRDLR